MYHKGSQDYITHLCLIAHISSNILEQIRALIKQTDGWATSKLYKKETFSGL